MSIHNFILIPPASGTALRWRPPWPASWSVPRERYHRWGAQFLPSAHLLSGWKARTCMWSNDNAGPTSSFTNTDLGRIHTQQLLPLWLFQQHSCLGLWGRTRHHCPTPWGRALYSAPLLLPPCQSPPPHPAPGTDMWVLNHPELGLGTCSSRGAMSPVILTGPALQAGLHAPCLGLQSPLSLHQVHTLVTPWGQDLYPIHLYTYNG